MKIKNNSDIFINNFIQIILYRLVRHIIIQLNKKKSITHLLFDETK